MGYISAIGALPQFMLKLQLNNVIKTLIRQAMIPKLGAQLDEGIIITENPITGNWSEARRDSIKALACIIQTIGFDLNDKGLFY